MRNIERKRDIWIAETTGLVLATFGLNYLSNRYGDSLLLKFALGGSGIGLIIQVIRLGIMEFSNEKRQSETLVTEVKEKETAHGSDKKNSSIPSGAFENLSGEELKMIDDDFGSPKRTRKRKKSK